MNLESGPHFADIWLLNYNYFKLSGFGDILQQKYENLDKKEDTSQHHDLTFIPKYKFIEKFETKYPE